MTKIEALNTLMKMRAWREWGKEQKEEERPEMPMQKEVDEAFDVCIKLLQSFLPSNLDEAAEVGWDAYYNSDKFPSDPCAQSGYKTGFKAGAEWMAGQGETFNGYISMKGKRSLIAIEGKSEYKFGDKVIVQIRKK